MAIQTTTPELNLDQIQGNILAGFNKDHQTLIFIRLSDDSATARTWLGEIAPDVASTTEVQAFNRLFKLVNGRRNSRHRGERGTVEATWVNVAFTSTGLSRLGADGMGAFPEEFVQGMAARAAQIGDVGANDPSTWRFGQTQTIDGVIIVAADSAYDLNREVAREHRLLARFEGVVIFEQEGRTRTDLPGHEHFGFKDGISQPGIRGFTDSVGADPNQGQPGQDLLWPGEFVLGYQSQKPPSQPGYDQGAVPRTEDPDPNPGDLSPTTPEWTKDGSYLVVRRLAQDVPGFSAAVAEMAQHQTVDPAMSVEQAGAKLVGRYESGAPREPVEGVATPPDYAAGDPSKQFPQILDESHINNFEYQETDATGDNVPLAAHIRKTYPRDEATIGGGEADTQTHRILRRGIPFGKPFRSAAPTDNPYGQADFPHDRGLIFACYQASIARQFETVQQAWANAPGFPAEGAGQDPIISQSTPTRQFNLPGGDPVQVDPFQQWVTMTGGEYFFQPSIGALQQLASPPTPPTPGAASAES